MAASRHRICGATQSGPDGRSNANRPWLIIASPCQSPAVVKTTRPFCKGQHRDSELTHLDRELARRLVEQENRRLVRHEVAHQDQSSRISRISFIIVRPNCDRHEVPPSEIHMTRLEALSLRRPVQRDRAAVPTVGARDDCEAVVKGDVQSGRIDVDVADDLMRVKPILVDDQAAGEVDHADLAHEAGHNQDGRARLVRADIVVEENRVEVRVGTARTAIRVHCPSEDRD